VAEPEIKPVRVAILGAGGWMGRVHALSYVKLAHVFGDSRGRAEIAWLVDRDPRQLATASANHPAARTSTDWRTALDDPSVDLIDVCLPDNLHYAVAKAALEAGKHVYCEKPFTETAAEARELAALALCKDAVTRVGHNFPCNPVHSVAKKLIAEGEIGEIRFVRASQHIDSLADPAAPFVWRCDRNLSATGIVGDTGSHVFSFLDYLVGPVAELIADTAIQTRYRPSPDGSEGAGMIEVTNLDIATVLCRFRSGAMGTIDFSRIAMGRKFMQTYEIYGTRGSLLYDNDEINRLRFYSDGDPIGAKGFREIDVGPEVETYRAFLPLPNFGIGYNETKLIEVSEVIRSVSRREPAWPTFADGVRLCELVDSTILSGKDRRWVRVGEASAAPIAIVQADGAPTASMAR
jgi:predicted dehydrogenase